MRTVKFGVIGCGLMGREFASAAARWCHLQETPARPEIVAVCDRSPEAMAWFQQHIGTVRQAVTDYRELLANPEVEAVYCAVPHHLHREVYCAVIAAGKHLMGEKPFGIDLPANQAILEALGEPSGVFARCCSQMPFYPAVQRIGNLIEHGELGEIIEVQTGFLHSSDLNVDKPINWKRIVEFNGEYGVMGDLGMHACHVVLRAGWRPLNVRALLSDIVKERPDGKGGRAPCRTWDNATLLCETRAPSQEASFPWTFRSHRIAPGEKNTWYVAILGTRRSVRFSTANTNLLETLVTLDNEQVWGRIPVGMEMPYGSITGGIFEPGFSDAVQQMWAGFLYELVEGCPRTLFSGCVTPEEAAWSHRLFTAALASHHGASVVPV